MKRMWMGVLMAASLGAAASAGPSPDSSAVTVPVGVVIPPDSNWVFSLALGSRLYPEWKDSVEVKLGQRFYLADTEFTAEVTEFMPDFKIHERKPVNFSSAMSNPAVHVFVYADTGAADSVWAFLNFPPHFSAKSFFTFQLEAVRGYAPGSGAPAAPSAKKEEGQ